MEDITNAELPALAKINSLMNRISTNLANSLYEGNNMPCKGNKKSS